MIPCGPVWSPFQDPTVDEDGLVETMTQRIISEAEQFEWTLMPLEKNNTALLRILRSQNHNIESSLAKWRRWVKWRRIHECDDIKEGDIEFEVSTMQAIWKGCDKAGRPCCVVTARYHDPINRPGGSNTFKKFLINTVEQGVKTADEGRKEICVIYDRRGLDYKHIDQRLFLLCRTLIADLVDWYGDRLGVIYIVHAHWLHWTLFHAVLNPLFSFFVPNRKVILVKQWSNLLEHFEESELLPDTLLIKDEEGNNVAAPSGGQTSFTDIVAGEEGNEGKSAHIESDAMSR